LTWLFLIAALLAYVPANLLSVMDVQFLGQSAQQLTIMDGVLSFWRDGDYDLASIVFVASVALPCTKFIALAWLLLSIHMRSRFARRPRNRLLHLLEIIGHWSMLDVLVVGILAGLVQFQNLGEIDPGVGILLFGTSVVLTMLSVRSLDSRLIWDDEPFQTAQASPIERS
jgi:paraquat-inducible protein A